MCSLAATSAMGRILLSRAISKSVFMSGCSPPVDAEVIQGLGHGGYRAPHVGWRNGTDAADAETWRRRVVEIADQHAACFQRIDEVLQVPAGIGRRVHVDDDRSLVLARQIRRQPDR